MDNFFVENKIEDRKLTLYAEAANYEYQFSLEDALLYSTSIEEYNMMCEDAEEKMQKASGNFFTRLAESIVKFFTKLGEKMEESRNSKAAKAAEKKLAELPELNSKRVEVPDVIYLKNACEGDTKLCEKLVKRYLAGNLTEDQLNRELGKSYLRKNRKERMKKITTTIAKVVAVVGGTAATALAIYKYRDKLQGLLDDLKRSKDKFVDRRNKIKAVKNAPANAVNKGKEIIGDVKVTAEKVGSKITETIKSISEGYTDAVKDARIAVQNAIDGSSAKVEDIKNHAVTVNGKTHANASTAISDLKSKGDTKAAKNVADNINSKISKAKEEGKSNGVLKNMANALSADTGTSEKRLNSSIADGSKRALSAEEISDIQSKLHKLNKSVNRNQAIDFTVDGKKVHYNHLGKAISRLATHGHIDEANKIIDMVNRGTTRKGR